MYASDRQRRFFHTKTAASKGITPAQVKEFDEASKGKDLPERASPKSRPKTLRERARERMVKK